MQTCSNCGAAIRPDARFCTTCGARLNDARATELAVPTQETQVFSPISTWGKPRDAEQPATPPRAQPQSGSETTEAPRVASNARDFSGWTSAYGTSESASSSPEPAPEPPAVDPASRFESALDVDDDPGREPTAAVVEEQPEEKPFTFNWTTPPPDAFRPISEKDGEDDSFTSTWTSTRPDSEQAFRWSTSNDEVSTDEPSAEGAGQIERDSPPNMTSEEEDLARVDDDADEAEVNQDEASWATPASWASVASTDNGSGAPDAAGFRSGGSDEVDYFSGDENIEVSAENAVPVAPISTEDSPSESTAEARRRATALLDELRSAIWLIGNEPAGTGDVSDAVITLSGARARTANFNDLTRLAQDARENPRDIDALRALGEKAERIEELLDSHERLVDAIDDAIRELRT